MSDVLKLAAQARDRVGKGASRSVRREGFVPAVIYGDKKEPLAIQVNAIGLEKLLNTGVFLNSVIEVEVGSKKHRTLPRDVQFHPVTDRALHVDFLRVSATTMVTVNIPVRFVNEEESPGLKRGGVLNVVRHEIEVRCPAEAMPDELIVDVAGLDIGDSVHISTVELPENVVPEIEDRDFTIATIAAPSALLSEEDEAAEEAAAAEGEEGEEAEDTTEEG